MSTYTHQVPKDVRETSTWDDDYSCFVTPDNRYWHYTDDPEQQGVSIRDASGERIGVAVWLKDVDLETTF